MQTRIHSSVKLLVLGLCLVASTSSAVSIPKADVDIGPRAPSGSNTLATIPLPQIPGSKREDSESDPAVIDQSPTNIVLSKPTSIGKRVSALVSPPQDIGIPRLTKPLGRRSQPSPPARFYLGARQQESSNSDKVVPLPSLLGNPSSDQPRSQHHDSDSVLSSPSLLSPKLIPGKEVYHAHDENKPQDSSQDRVLDSPALPFLGDGVVHTYDEQQQQQGEDREDKDVESPSFLGLMKSGQALHTYDQQTQQGKEDDKVLKAPHIPLLGSSEDEQVVHTHDEQDEQQGEDREDKVVESPSFLGLLKNGQALHTYDQQTQQGKEKDNVVEAPPVPLLGSNEDEQVVHTHDEEEQGRNEADRVVYEPEVLAGLFGATPSSGNAKELVHTYDEKRPDGEDTDDNVIEAPSALGGGQLMHTHQEKWGDANLVNNTKQTSNSLLGSSVWPEANTSSEHVRRANQQQQQEALKGHVEEHRRRRRGPNRLPTGHH